MGMWLRIPEQSQNRNLTWIIRTAAAGAAFCALTIALEELTGLEMTAALLTGVCFCLVCGLLACVRRQGWFYPGGLILMLLLVLLFRQQVLEGICMFWNQAGDAWTSATGWVLPELQTQLPSRESGTCLLLASILLGGLGAMLCCGLASACPAIPAVLLPGLVLAAMAGFRQELSVVSMLTVLAAAAFLLLSSGWGRGEAGAPVLRSWMVFTAVGCILVSAAVLPWAVDRARAFSADLREAIHTSKFETKYTTLPEGDLTDVQDPAEDALPALMVTMEEPEAMYLRGFTGAVFEDGAWSALDPEILAANEDLLYWLNLNAFNPAAQFSSAMLSGGAGENRITVQNIGACSRYLYVPFTLSAGVDLAAENLNTDAIRSDGERIYAFSCVSGGADLVSSVLEHLQTSDEEAVSSYRKAESAYRDFVYSHYLDVPGEIRDLLAEEWARYGDPERLSVQEAQASALDFLDRSLAEDALPGPEGSSFRYATVAAMTLRHFGIPARYAEGYVITEDMAAQGDGTIEVDSTCAGAWVEVYQDGIGWIPMALIPGLGEGSGNGAGEGMDREQTDLKEGEELEETPEDNAEAPEPDGGFMVTVSKAVGWGALLALLLLLVLVLLLVVRRRILCAARDKRFHGEDRSDAVAWIFADTVLLLEMLGFDRGNGPVGDLCGPIRQRFGAEYAEMLEEGIALNAMAIFSSRELSEAQRDQALALYRATQARLQSDCSWSCRLWMKWIRCLY